MTKQINHNTKIPEVEINFPLTELMHQAKKQGYLLADDLLAIFPEAEENIGSLDDLFIHLINQGIEIYVDTKEIEEKGSLSLDGQSCKLRKDLFDLSHIPPDDVLTLYLKEMAWVPLLTSAQEVALAKLIEKGGKAEKQLKEIPPDSKKARSLRAQIEAGRQACDHLIKANTRLVISVAKKYRRQGMPFTDLIQEGNLGLMKAVEKFDYRRGYKFSTYATWWIRQGVTRALADQSRTIRLPVQMSDRIRKLRQVADRCEQVLGRKPTVEELALETDLEPAKIEWMMRVSQQPLSLEEPVGVERDNEFGNFIEDEEALSPPDTTSHHILRDRIEDILITLTPREARIIRLRFGLQNGRYYTLEEIGRKFGLTRERIRQIEAQALRKLRHPRRTRQIRDYLG